MSDPSDRRTPPETPDEWAHIWGGSRKAHELWTVLAPLSAILKNWKAIGIGLAIGLAIGGKQLLISLGVMLP